MKAAYDAFNEYAALDGDDLPGNDLSALQVCLARWQTRNFGGGDTFLALAGATEELGELAHALVKHRQRIREYVVNGTGDDNKTKLRSNAGDAIADCVIYLIQLCTLLRLDFGVLLKEAAANVLERDWLARPAGDA